MLNTVLLIIKFIVKLILALLTLSVFTVLFINLFVILSASSNMKTIDDIRHNPSTYEDHTILVLGAGIIDQETPSRILKGRLDTTLGAHKIYPEKPIIVSGDHNDIYYDEVYVMKHYLKEADVPSELIYQDHAGYSTYDSLYRAKEIIGEDQLIIITQPYHLSRSLMIARNLGIDAIGLEAQEVNSTRFNREIREVAARLKDWAYLYLDVGTPNPELNYGFQVDGDGDQTDVKEDLFQENSTE